MPTDLPPGYTGQPRERDQLTAAQSALVLLALVAMLCATVVAVVWMATS